MSYLASLPPSAQRTDGAALSYAPEADQGWQRTLIRSIESLTGATRLQRRYRELQVQVARGADPWGAALSLLGIDVQAGGREDVVPTTGPLVAVANHPFGLVDGLVACHLLARTRSDYRVIANSVLMQVPEVAPYVLPIEFRDCPEAARINARSRRDAARFVANGGALMVFPAGAVSTSDGWFGKVVDLPWTPFVAKLARQEGARVLPMYFPGENGRVFQAVSQFSPTLRLALLVREACRHIGAAVQVRIGDAMAAPEFSHLDDRESLTAFLRAQTFALADSPCPTVPDVTESRDTHETRPARQARHHHRCRERHRAPYGGALR